MRSSSGEHFLGLDHVRAVAAFLVFSWHFLHSTTGYPIPFGAFPRVLPLCVIDEGHTGVALFMTLSGYLFAKLLEGRQIRYGRFLWNRVLRLLPLLLVVVFLAGLGKLLRGENLGEYVKHALSGVILPTLPNGGWSVTIEFHFYVLLPGILWLSRRYSWSLPLTICIALLSRTGIYAWFGDVQPLAYGTIVGRIDQFLLGIMASKLRHVLARRHLVFIALSVGFVAFYGWFDASGGLYASPRRFVWIFLPTVEGLFYGAAIAWYDSSFAHPRGLISRAIARAGQFSYSVYLLHFFVVFRLARIIDTHVMRISNFYVGCLWSLLCFGLVTAGASLSYRFIEAPFLKLRTSYTVPRPSP